MTRREFLRPALGMVIGMDFVKGLFFRHEVKCTGVSTMDLVEVLEMTLRQLPAGMLEKALSGTWHYGLNRN